jgi:hypothetical protein
MLSTPAEAATEDVASSPPLPEAPFRGRRLDESKIRLVENWIVAVVTLVSAGVIVATLWSHRDQARTSGSSSQAASGAGAIPR